MRAGLHRLSSSGIAIRASFDQNLADDGTVSIKRLSAERFVLLARQAAPELYDEKARVLRRAGNFSPQVVNEPDRTSTVRFLWSRALAFQ